MHEHKQHAEDRVKCEAPNRVGDTGIGTTDHRMRVLPLCRQTYTGTDDEATAQFSAVENGVVGKMPRRFCEKYGCGPTDAGILKRAAVI
eukprot:50637-Eustigmatos_ZCMA.PRE.1